MRVSMIALAAAAGLTGFFSPPAPLAAQEPARTFVLDTATGAVTERLAAVEKDHAESKAELKAEIAELRKAVQSLQRSASPAPTAVAAAPPLSLPEPTCKCGPACPKGGCIDCECPTPSVASVGKPTGKRLVQVCDGKSCRLVEVDDGPAVTTAVATAACANGSCGSTATAGATSGGTCSATAAHGSPVRRILGCLFRRCR